MKSITYSALSLHGWNVAASHATAGSKVAIDDISEFASLPVRPLFAFTINVSTLTCIRSHAEGKE
jgi:hypothetical protein